MPGKLDAALHVPKEQPISAQHSWMNPTILNSTDSEYPARLRERLGERAPKTLHDLGDSASLSPPKTALFCSVRCPGDAILRACDAAQKLRDGAVTVVSGFHSPVEKECL